MICKSEEASNYKCCMMEKQCEGNACMAWKVYYISEHSKVPDFDGRVIPMLPAPVDSGKGYCGLVEK